MSASRNVIEPAQSSRTTNVGNIVTPRQLLSIKTLFASLKREAKSEFQHLFDRDLRTLSVASAARLIADLRSQLIRQEAQNNEDYEFPPERSTAIGSIIEG